MAAVGDVVPEMPITIPFRDMVTYSGEGNIHSSDEEAAAQGLGSALIQGGQLTGHFVRYLMQSFGATALVGGGISATFLRPVRADVEVFIGGTVTAASESHVECDLWFRDEAGQKLAVATARVSVGTD